MFTRCTCTCSPYRGNLPIPSLIVIMYVIIPFFPLYFVSFCFIIRYRPTSPRQPGRSCERSQLSSENENPKMAHVRETLQIRMHVFGTFSRWCTSCVWQLATSHHQWMWESLCLCTHPMREVFVCFWGVKPSSTGGLLHHHFSYPPII